MACLLSDNGSFSILVEVFESPIAHLASHFLNNVVLCLRDIHDNALLRIFFGERLVRIVAVFRQHLVLLN